MLAADQKWDLLEELADKRGAKPIDLDAGPLAKNHKYCGYTLAWVLTCYHKWDLLEKLANKEGAKAIDLKKVYPPENNGNLDDELNWSFLLQRERPPEDPKHTLDWFLAQYHQWDLLIKLAAKDILSQEENSLFKLVNKFIQEGININAKKGNKEETAILVMAKRFKKAIDKKDSNAIELLGNIIRVLVACKAKRFEEDYWEKTVFDIQKDCPELGNFLKNEIECELDKYVLNKILFIKNLLAENFVLEDRILVNDKEYEVITYIRNEITQILTYAQDPNMSFDLSPFCSNELIRLLNIESHTKYNTDEKKHSLTLSNDDKQRIAEIVKGLTYINQLIVRQEKISEITLTTMNFNIEVKFKEIKQSLNSAVTNSSVEQPRERGRFFGKRPFSAMDKKDKDLAGTPENLENNKKIRIF